MKILLFCRDPGGANTVIPLVKPLKDRGHAIELWAKDEAVKYCASHGLLPQDLAGHLSSISETTLKDFLNDRSFDLVITGTSANDNTEKWLWKVAESLTIPSIAIVDQWLNIGIRFSRHMVRTIELYHSERDISYLPTRILVADESMRLEAIMCGIASDRIIVTGNPHFDSIKSAALAVTSERILEVRQKLIGLSKSLIVFASEPMTESYADPVDYWGYSEQTIFAQVSHALISIDAQLILRPHPRELPGKIEQMAKASPVPCTVEGNKSAVEIILAANLICGMSSMFLAESCILGKRAMSIQIGLKRTDPFIFTRLGVLRRVSHFHELQGQILQLLNNDTIDSPFPIIENATLNVIDVVENIKRRCSVVP